MDASLVVKSSLAAITILGISVVSSSSSAADLKLYFGGSVIQSQNNLPAPRDFQIGTPVFGEFSILNFETPGQRRIANFSIQGQNLTFRSDSDRDFDARVNGNVFSFPGYCGGECSSNLPGVERIDLSIPKGSPFFSPEQVRVDSGFNFQGFLETSPPVTISAPTISQTLSTITVLNKAFDQSPLPPSQSKYTQEQKQQFSKDANRLGGAAAVLGVSSAACGIVVGFGTPCAIVSGVLAGTLGYGAYNLNEMALDPPDPNFTVIKQPSVPSLSRLPITTDDGIDQQTADALNGLLNNQLQSLGLQSAILTSLNRAG